ncbi:MAG: SPFH domain-containing protein [Armatimonadota bacterium]
MEMNTQLLIGIGAVVLFIIILAKIYTVVPADYAHVVIQRGKMRVFSSHPEYTQDSKGAYFNIPSWFFLFGLGMRVHKIPLKIIPVRVQEFLAFDIDRARFLCDIIAYVAVKKPIVAAQRFSGDMLELAEQIARVVQATTRDATTKKTIREIINNRDEIIRQITPALASAIDAWGLDLKDIELVEFKDPVKPQGLDKEASHVITDISSIIEEQINSEARQKNADQRRAARLKEAIADEEARKREIQRDEEVAKRIQEKNRLIAEKEKEAVREQLEVTKVDKIKNAEIEKEKKLVIAAQDKEVEEIYKQQQRLKGEGERSFLEEQAKGLAAPIREKGYAEADAKEKLQEALNKFGDEAIRALVAEKIVAMQEAVGIAGAKALENADFRVFAGSETDKAGFDIGKALEAITVASDQGARSVLNRLARPNDLGIGNIKIKTDEKKEENKDK